MYVTENRAEAGAAANGSFPKIKIGARGICGGRKAKSEGSLLSQMTEL
jgi:hypothetical protein